ncbi:MAG: MarC family protein [Zavarzinella sp.]
MIDFVATFIILFAIIDPIGTIPVFIAVTAKYTRQQKKKIAIKAITASAGILIFFVIAGEWLLRAMEIPIPAFQIAGGIVLFLFALSMIFGESKPEQEIKLPHTDNETAIYPLAVPSIAGPGAMLTAVLLTENSRYTIWQQAQTVFVMLVVLAIALVGMLLASYVHRIIGNSGASVISRVMGLILASAAMSNTLNGIKQFFQL